MKFAANISHLWADLPWSDRFDAAAAAGFEGVEALFPYDAPAAETQAALRRNKLTFLLLNAPPPNYTGGERGYAAIPDRSDRFAHDLRRAFRYAGVLGAKYLHIMSGVAEGPEAMRVLKENLRHASAAAPAGLTLTLKPLNQEDMPGYFLNSFKLAADIITDLNLPNLAMQYDSYHAEIIEGDARATFNRYAHLIRHIQIADAPGRAEPRKGTIDFSALFNDIIASGYKGWISAEYNPGKDTDKTLRWLKRRVA